METEFRCEMCGSTFTRHSNLQRHMGTVHNINRDNICHTCNKSYSTAGYLARHVCRPTLRARRRLIRIAEFEDSVETYDRTSDDHNLDMLLRRTWDSIKSGLRSHRYVEILNCRLYRFDGDEAPQSPWEALQASWNRFNCSVKINCSVGCVLRHKVDKTYRYYHSSSNNATLFPQAQSVTSLTDLRATFDAYTALDVRELSANRRPDTAWGLVAITNVTFFMYKLLDTTRVGNSPVIPNHIRDNQNILSSNKCSKTGKIFQDNLCFFRCLLTMYDMTTEKGLVRKPHLKQPPMYILDRALQYWINRQSCLANVTPQNFDGISLDMLYEMEDIFDVSISIFTLDADRNSEVIWSSGKKKNCTLNLIQVDNHFCLIKDIELFANTYSCGSCSQIFTRRSSLQQHTCKVRDVSRLVFPGGTFKEPATIFDRLLYEVGIEVKKELRMYPYMATYDIECYFDKTRLPSPTNKLSYSAEHRLLSISVCSNVNDFDKPKCFVTTGCPRGLVKRFTKYLLRIAKTAEELMKDKFASIIEQLDSKREEIIAKEKSAQRGENSGDKSHMKIDRLQNELEEYLKTIPVISFNGQRYDLQVLKSDLISELLAQDPDQQTEGLRFVIKKNSSMVCLESDHLRFIDITNFIAPGSNYAGYLKAFGCEEEKGFFPYEWVDSLDKLLHSTLPPKKAFYSSLTGKGISDDDYKYCQRVWEEKNMLCFRDFLIWYNNRDVEPFLEALERQCKLYEEQGIDLFKSNISLPGAAVRWMLKLCDRTENVISRESWQQWIDSEGADVGLKQHIDDKRAVFTVCDKYTPLYDVCKDNMVGGPSIVFHRYHEVGKTHIRPLESNSIKKPCGLIQGYDANALYVWCLQQDQPVGRPAVSIYTDNTLSETIFPSTSGWSKAAHCWLEWLSCSSGQFIRHKNNGGEISVGEKKYSADGFNPYSRTVYEFLGCYWHGHDCTLNRGKDDDSHTHTEERRTKTATKLRHLSDLGYTVKYIWECEWKNQQQSDETIKRFTKLFYKSHYPFRAKRDTLDSVTQAISEDRFFGFIECDIHVPVNLKEKFSEMNPIFKNVPVSRDHLSPKMREFAIANNHLSQSQRMLVGCDKGESILLHSELLKWYLSHGLVVTSVYRTFQYSRAPVFKDFVTEVTDARRKGDQDPSLALLASTYKLAGNSVYGKTITNKERHQQMKYSEDPVDISRTIRSRYFVSLEEFESSVCEMILHKRKIKMDVPVIIGFSILQLAKLRMLQFYYDFMDKFISRTDFQYVEMDTDSAYMALSDTLENIIRPEMRNEFYHTYGEWFPRPYCENHRSEYISNSLNRQSWKPYSCCKLVLKSDARTPGLFKQEFQGHGIVALNSKTYYCWNKDHTDNKFSSKGLSKRTNSLSAQTYKDVLFSKQSHTGSNTGFMQKDGHTYTYHQSRDGLSYFYGKRFVCDDGISTRAIDI